MTSQNLSALELSIYGKHDLITIEQTNASIHSKWVATWHPQNDTFILYSKDIGILAGRFNGKAITEPVEINAEIDSLAQKAFRNKYKMN